MNMIGHNRPPDGFAICKKRITDLYEEARQWLDGEPITDQEQADALNTLASHIRDAAKEAEENRKIEAKPFDDGKADVQARYKPLKTMADNALDSVKAALVPYLMELDRKQREIAENARKEAEQKRIEAELAFAVRDASNLEQREQAEKLLADAKSAEAAAARSEKAKAHAKGDGRATGLRTHWAVTVENETAAMQWAWMAYRSEMLAACLDLAKAEVRRGKRSIEGFSIIEEKVL